MEKSIRLVVVDDNKEVTSSIKKYFGVSNEIKVVACINNGEEALDFIINNHDDIDLVVLDVLVPRMDGLSLLENLRNRKIHKKVLVLSSFKDEFVIKQLTKYDVNYVMIKPFSLESLEERIKDMFEIFKLQTYSANSNKDASVEIKVSEILHDLGVPSHLRGYRYIRDGVIHIYHSHAPINLITKEVYPEIANKYETTSTRVERAIRHAIEVSWERGDMDLMEELFGHSIEFERSKPTNSEFINTIADRVKIHDKLLVN